MKKKIGLLMILLIIGTAGLCGCNDVSNSNDNSYDYNSFNFNKVKVTINVDVNPIGIINFTQLKVKFPSDDPSAKYFEGAEISKVDFVLYGNNESTGDFSIDSKMVLPKNLTVVWFKHFQIYADDLHQVLSDAVKNSKEIEWVASGVFILAPPNHSTPIQVTFESESFLTH